MTMFDVQIHSNTITLRWETKIITSECLQNLETEKDFAFLRVGFEQSAKVSATPKIRRTFDYISTTLLTCPSTRNSLRGPQGNVFEKEIFENTWLASSVRYTSKFSDRNGNISRYNAGQFSFTKFRATLSESGNFAMMTTSQRESARGKSKLIHR